MIYYFNARIVHLCIAFNQVNHKYISQKFVPRETQIFETPWGWHRDVETCRSEHYI